jgi:hypothetical protein
MFSPFKLTSIESNSHLVSSNVDLANKIGEFFKNPSIEFLWGINTTRQRVTKALQHTCMIALREPVANSQVVKTTQDWNQVTTIRDTPLLSAFPIFQELRKWIELALLDTGASTVEFGRIFFSKHYANSNIDIHTDSGAYFDYYDRFHFVIEQVDYKNIFHIREENVLLEQGKLYWVNNHVPHWLRNDSEKDRINLIFDARLS